MIELQNFDKLFIHVGGDFSLDIFEDNFLLIRIDKDWSYLAFLAYLQFFGFDLSEVEGNLGNRVGKHLLTLLLIGLVVLFAGLLCWNTGLIGAGGLE